MKKQYVIPVIKMQEVCLRSCIMSGEPGGGLPGPQGQLNDPMPTTAARRLYA